VQTGKLIMLNSGKSETTQSLALHAIVHDVAQATQLLSGFQSLLRLLYGCGNAEAESRAVIYFYRHGSV
jgi:hypothetical protein